VVREATTDVAGREEFADRLTVKAVDGRAVGGWFSEDFTLAEIRRLKAVERMPALRPQNVAFDGRFGVPTLEDVIHFLRSTELRQPPGLYIELKHPTYFRHEGRRLDGEPIAIDLGERLLETLLAGDFVDPARVYIQCFEVAPLIELKDRMAAAGLSLPLIQLLGDVTNRRYRAIPRDVAFNAARGETGVYGDLDRLIPGGITAETSYAELATPEGLGFMARRYAAGIGPNRFNVLDLRPGENGPEFTGALTPLLEQAVTAGLAVHPWTLRAEPQFLVRQGSEVLTVAQEVRLLLTNGAGGFFIDQPALGRAAVDEFLDDDTQE
jgi:glycerophosphoryl diester phosphodiesterase